MGTTVIVFLFWFGLGLVMGSFLNVVAHRYRVSTLLGRSECPVCGHELAWYDLIPVVSYLLIGGRCRYCRARLSPQYILVELCVGLLFGLSWIFVGYTVHLVFVILLLCLAVVLSLYDIRHFVLPRELVFAFGLVGLADRLVYMLAGGVVISSDVVVAFVSPLLLSLVFFAVHQLSKGRMMGFGDVLLVGAIGLWLGLFPGFIAIVVACWLGSVVGIGYGIYRQIVLGSTQSIMKTRLPFGPYLLIGAFVVYFAKIYGVIEVLESFF